MYAKENLNKIAKLASLTPDAMQAFRTWDKIALEDGAIAK